MPGWSRRSAARAGDQRGARRGEVADSEPAGAARAQVGQRGLGLGEVLADDGGVLGEQPARRGRPDTATDAFEQGDARLLLQGGHLLADRGGRVAQVRCRGGHRSAGDDRAQHLHPTHIEHAAQLNGLCTTFHLCC